MFNGKSTQREQIPFRKQVDLKSTVSSLAFQSFLFKVS